VRRLQDADVGAPVTVPAAPDLAPLPFFAVISQLFFDITLGDVLAVQHRAAGMAAECRDAGLVGLLAYALFYLATAEFLRGEFLDAMASADEGLRIAADTGQTALTGVLAETAALLAAITGDERAYRARVAQVRDLSASAQALSLAGADCAFALLDLGSGRRLMDGCPESSGHLRRAGGGALLRGGGRSGGAGDGGGCRAGGDRGGGVRGWDCRGVPARLPGEHADVVRPGVRRLGAAVLVLPAGTPAGAGGG
jgi:hypothetical protein